MTQTGQAEPEDELPILRPYGAGPGHAVLSLIIRTSFKVGKSRLFGGKIQINFSHSYFLMKGFK